MFRAGFRYRRDAAQQLSYLMERKSTELARVTKFAEFGNLSEMTDSKFTLTELANWQTL